MKQRGKKKKKKGHESETLVKQKVEVGCMRKKARKRERKRL